MTLAPEQLHVIRLYPRLPPLPGGMERHIAALTAAQRAQGVRVTEIYNQGAPAGEALQVWRGQALHDWRPATLRDFLFYGAAIRRRGAIAPGGVPVVHAHGDCPAFLMADRLGSALAARAVAASLHGRLSYPPWLYRRALRRCDPIFTTGLVQAEKLRDLTGHAVLHLPSAPDALFFGAAKTIKGAAEVVAVGNLHPVKNLALVLRCAALLPALRFAIYGDGPQRAELESLRARQGLNNVRFHGAVSPEEIHAAMSSAHLFINTSLSEGSPTAALEAMACRLPVLLTPSNDYAAIVEPGVNGRVTRGWEVAELVAGVAEFTAPDRHRAAGEAGRAIAERHCWADKARVVTAAMLAAAEANPR